MLPLTGIKILDLSTLLPGPLATLMLAEAGAEVVKVERPGRGDEMRSYEPKFGADSVNFAMLNRGKRSLALDLKDPAARLRLVPLIREADVLVEQFRPGVLDRLGLGYEAMRALNPRLIYCSITGFGQSGPDAMAAAHDLNYCAKAGVLALATGVDGAPGLPPALIADIAGGSYPAVVNILLAMLQRERTGEGVRLDVAMADNLFMLQYWALGNGLAAGHWPKPGSELVTGGSPRYRIYRTADDRFVAAAPIEDKFWFNFLAVLGLDASDVDDGADPAGAAETIAARIRAEPAGVWRERFAGKDVCANIVADLREALTDPQFIARNVFAGVLESEDGRIAALPMPIAAPLRGPAATKAAPPLGEANASLLGLPG